MNSYDSAYRVGMLFGSIIGGLLVGCIPAYFALKRGQKTLAWVAVFVCVVANFLLGILLSIPVAIIFTLIIFTVKNKAA